jgi:hypothetical protein
MHKLEEGVLQSGGDPDKLVTLTVAEASILLQSIRVLVEDRMERKGEKTNGRPN